MQQNGGLADGVVDRGVALWFGSARCLMGCADRGLLQLIWAVGIGGSLQLLH